MTSAARRAGSMIRAWKSRRSSLTVIAIRPSGLLVVTVVAAARNVVVLRYGLSYRDVEELLAERGVEVDHVTVFRWVQFTPLLAEATRFCRHSPGDRWFVDETFIKVNGVWRATCTGRLTSTGRSSACWSRPVATHSPPAVLPMRSGRLEGDAGRCRHRRRGGLPRGTRRADPVRGKHVNNPIEADHGQRKHRLRPTRGLHTDPTAGVIIAGHAFMQNPRRGTTN
jgi:IS6 family transposase